MHYLTIHHLTAVHLFILLLQYGYALLFPIAVVEGPLAAIVAGALIASGELNGYFVFFLLIAADLVGDFIYYSLGRWGHVRMIEKLSSGLGLSKDRLKPIEREFKKNDWKFLLVGKTQGLGAIILYFAGVTKMSLKRFFLWNFIGTVPKVLIFMAIGYLFGQTIIGSQRALDYITVGAFAMGIVLLVGYWRVKIYMEGKVAVSFAEES